MIPAWLTLAACAVLTPDPDHDGLSSRDEADLGTDPQERDSDGDGLADGDEVAWGSDPRRVDTDGDGLSDGDDVEAGADPTRVDTDFDGYLDPWEDEEHTNPGNPGSRIYTGNWPYNPEKESLGPVRGRIPAYEMKDQFEDVVFVYDFAGHGVDVVFVRMAAWCIECRDLADWLGGEPNATYDALAPDVPAAIADRSMTWIVLLVEGNHATPVEEGDAADWSAQHPNPYVPVLGDEWDASFYLWENDTFPVAYIYDEDLIQVTTSGVLEEVLLEAQARL